jgi:hypothetical protein
MHNANYTKKINSNEEIFIFFISSLQFEQHLKRTYTRFPVAFNECIYQLLN